MSLLGWLGREQPTPNVVKKVDPRSLSPILKRPTHERIVLGVLGTRSNIRYEDMETDVFAPLVEAWGFPDEVIVPAESDSSQILLTWAKEKGVPVRLISCDWVTQGRKAGLLRDSRIQREATHLLLLQGPRSNALMQLATRLERKGRPVVISERPGQPIKSVHTQ
jgi:hypothetical protein